MPGLGTETNRLVSVINGYKNTYGDDLKQCLIDVGLTEPITEVSLSGLTITQLGQLLVQASKILTIAGQEVLGARSFETNLSTLGYASVDEAITDVPNVFSGSTATEIILTLTEIKEDLAYLDTTVTSAFVFSLFYVALTLVNRNEDTSNNIHNVQV